MKIKNITDNEEYKKIISEIDTKTLENAKILLITERIKKYPERPLSKILDVEYDLERDVDSNCEYGV